MKDKQTEKILENVKQKIAISNFEKKERLVMKNTRKSMFKIGITACCVIVSMTGIVFAKDIGNFVKNLFGKNTSDGVDTAVNEGYVANVNTEYQTAEGIEISVESLIMDDFNFAMNFDVKLSEGYNIDEFERVELSDLMITDETGKIVFNTKDSMTEIESGYTGSYSMLSTKKSDNEFTISLSATGNTEAFPKSKHLTVKFTKLTTSQYVNEQRQDTVYEGNWIFEVDVPEEFYNRESIIYKVKSCSEEGIDINQVTAVVSNTAFKLSIPEILTDKIDYALLKTDTVESIYDRIALQKEYVETEDGKRFEIAARSDGDGGYSVPEEGNKITNYHQTFNLTQYDATDEITVHIFTNRGEEITLVLEKM